MCQFLKGLNNKTKLTIYKTFGGEVKFKRYLNGVGDAGTRLLFKLRSGTHGLKAGSQYDARLALRTLRCVRHIVNHSA